MGTYISEILIKARNDVYDYNAGCIIIDCFVYFSTVNVSVGMLFIPACFSALVCRVDGIPCLAP